MATTRIVPTGQNPDLVTFTILVEGNEVSHQYHITDITVQCALDKIPDAVFTVADGEANRENFGISDSGFFLPGKKIEIRLGYHAENKTVFKGIIISNTHRITRDATELIVECRSEAIRMTIDKKSRHYNDVLDSEVVTKLLSDNNLADNEVEDSTVRHEQLVQANTSDWDFMVSRIDVNGMACLIMNGKIIAKKPDLAAAEKLQLGFGANILEFSADMDARTQNTIVKNVELGF